MNHRTPRNVQQIWLLILVTLLAFSILKGASMQQQAQVETVPYSQYLKLLDGKQVLEVTAVGEGLLQSSLRDGRRIEVYAPPGTSGPLIERLVAEGVAVKAQPEPGPSWGAMLLAQLLPWLLLGILWMVLVGRMQRGPNDIAKRFVGGMGKPVAQAAKIPAVRFADVAGVDEAKEELQEVVQFLRDPGAFQSLGARIPKGVLLAGPPGTGKTLLARAVAGEAGVPFFHISGSCFVELFVGVGAARVRELFEQAKKAAPAIIFIDEIDSIGSRRGAGIGGGHDEREHTLNQLLVEMDGFETTQGVIVIAATNRADMLDPALLRPGRFDRRVTLELPDREGRLAILRVHARRKRLAADVNLEAVAAATPGLSGADLENLLNEAAILAARHGRTAIGREEVDEAIERQLLGLGGRRRPARPQDRLRTAYHEAGHALAAHFAKGADPVRKVTIAGRGRAGGYTLSLPVEERSLFTASELRARLVQLMGGRAAEALALGEVSTGASQDLRQAAELARAMVTELGMSDGLGPLAVPERSRLPFLGLAIGSGDNSRSDAMAATIDREVHRLVAEAYEKAAAILKQHREVLDRVAQALLEREPLDREEFLAVVEAGSLETSGLVATVAGTPRTGKADPKARAHAKPDRGSIPDHRGQTPARLPGLATAPGP